MTKEKMRRDVLTGEENFRGEHVEEEIEFYDMENLEQKLLKKIQGIEEKLDVVLEEVNESNRRVGNIQAQFTRQLIFRIVKWAIILGFIWWLYVNFVGPMVSVVSEKYFQISSLIERGDAINGNTESLGETIGDFFPEAANALEKLRPGSSPQDTPLEN